MESKTFCCCMVLLHRSLGTSSTVFQCTSAPTQQCCISVTMTYMLELTRMV